MRIVSACACTTECSQTKTLGHGLVGQARHSATHECGQASSRRLLGVHKGNVSRLQSSAMGKVGRALSSTTTLLVGLGADEPIFTTSLHSFVIGFGHVSRVPDPIRLGPISNRSIHYPI